MLSIQALEEAAATSDDSNESPPSDIVAYSELRSAADLHRMYTDGILEIDPDFQRDFIWKSTDQTRFIDSLVKQLPIPSMCFAFDFNQNKWIVIDGLQRISTIVRFLNGDDWRLSSLKDIDQTLAGVSVATIKNSKNGNLQTIFRRVQNQALPINVLRCNFNKSTHNEYLFTIFHRLNSGGMQLQNQEIRNCIYSGPFNTLLKELDSFKPWRSMNRMREKENYRFAKQEIILRFFAFSEELNEYKGSISKFLNDYMQKNRHCSEEILSQKRLLFSRIINSMSSTIENSDAIPNTVLEAVLIGVSKNIDHIESLDSNEKSKRLAEFRSDNSVSAEALSEGLSKKDRIEARLGAATIIFAK